MSVTTTEIPLVEVPSAVTELGLATTETKNGEVGSDATNWISV